MSLLRPILRHAILHGSRTAVIDDQRSYSHFSLSAAAMFVAREIDQKTQASHVGIMLPTSGAFPIALLGCWLSGRVAVPINYLLARDELQYVLKDSDIDTLITVEPMLEFIGGPELIPDGIQLLRLDKINFKGVPPLRWPQSFGDDEVAVMLYTSGTSGRPKGVMLTHGNLHSNVLACIEHAKVTPDKVLLGVLPQFHSFGLTVLTLLPLYAGAKVIYSARFVPRKVIDLIRQHQPHMFVAVPSMYGALLSVKNAGPEDFSSIELAVSGGEPLPDTVFEAFRERFNITLLEGYGLTETSPVSHWSTPDSRTDHSVGKPLPGVRTYIFDETGHILGVEQEGEIVLAGPNIMKGYYKQPQQTAEVMVELPADAGAPNFRGFRTGDIGKVDDQGRLYITGRKKEMLIIGGENVFPREIEEVLNRHPAIKASVVVGKRDDMRGEVPIAFVELNEGQELDEAAVRNFCRESLAQFKVPREIRVLEELPRSPTGKVLRRKLPVD